MIGKSEWVKDPTTSPFKGHMSPRCVRRVTFVKGTENITKPIKVVLGAMRVSSIDSDVMLRTL